MRPPSNPPARLPDECKLREQEARSASGGLEVLADGARLDAVCHAEFPEQVGDMHAGGLLVDEQGARDLAVGVSIGEMAEDLDLPNRQTVGIGRANGSRRHLRGGPEVESSSGDEPVGFFEEWLGACGLGDGSSLGDESGGVVA
jgi:hypothetical protein